MRSFDCYCSTELFTRLQTDIGLTSTYKFLSYASEYLNKFVLNTNYNLGSFCTIMMWATLLSELVLLLMITSGLPRSISDVKV